MARRLPQEHIRAARTDAWYKQAIIYGIDVERFFDGNGDGIGDFHGLTTRLDYLASLGVTCLWLMPFFESPNRDNGYDIVDYYSVDHRLGTLGDFVEFMNRAQQLGFRVLIDLVLNHTSKDHPWFQAARRDPDSPYREYYIWSDKKPSTEHDLIMFPGAQTTNWTYDKVAGAYYMHRFYEHQPDLNLASAWVRDEMRKIMGFWLKLGIAGFRVDAAPHLIELPRPGGKRGRDAYEYLSEMYRFTSWRSPQSILLAEANINQKVVLEYLGNGDRMQMLYNFILNQYIMLALVRGSTEPLLRGMELLPELPRDAQWVLFLRKLDELDLGGLSENERQEVFAAFGPEPEMQVYGRGIRRRLAPMLGGDRRRLELAYSLLFSLPGTPLLMYGDEIGMGEDLSLPERESVRTVMQWSNDRNAGFSVAPNAPKRPMVREGPFSPQHVNVAEQEGHDGSLLNWMQKLVHTRQRHPEIGVGQFHVLKVASPAVFAADAEWEDGRLISVHNLSDHVQQVKLPRLTGVRLLSVFENREYAPLRAPNETFGLDPYGYRWFSVHPAED